LARTDKLKYASANFVPRRFTSRNSAGWCKRLRGSKVSLLINLGVVRVPDPRVLRAEQLATLGAAAGEQSATALRGHARAKTVGTGSMQITGIESTFHSATQAKTTGQINELGDLRKAARVLSEHGCVNRRLSELELDSLPFRLLCPVALNL
jgi:hypothetical protein